MTTSNCYVSAAGQSNNAGCGITDPDGTSYGTAFNANNGGVFATEWTSDAISIWFFERGSIPDDIDSGNPDPDSWGSPVARFQGDCDIDAHFDNLQIVCSFPQLLHYFSIMLLLFVLFGCDYMGANMLVWYRSSILPSAATGPVMSGVQAVVRPSLAHVVIMWPIIRRLLPMLIGLLIR